MKKIIYTFALFLSFISTYYCEANPYFKSFEIVNGTMNMDYDRYNNTYTVYIDSKENNLDFRYELNNPEDAIVITGNDYFINDINEVKIMINNDIGEKTTYTFIVHKYDAKEISSLDNTMVELNIKKDKIHIESVITMISCSVIIFSFYRLFLRHKV